MKRKIRVGSRESKLAVVQSEMIIQELKKLHPQLEIELVTMKTTGDKILDRSLDQIGGKGLFVKELDRALLDGEIDLAVHCLKDMPMETPKELPILAYSRREDPRDVLVPAKGKENWNGQGVIGCSSFRRRIQLQKLYPDAEVRGIRGNIQTRLQKLDSGQYDVLVLAAAGIKRLGLEERIERYFSPEEILPAAGQGILVVQGREEMRELVKALQPEEMEVIAENERAFVRRLDGGCSSPVAAYGRIQQDELVLTGLYYEEDTGNYVIATKRAEVRASAHLGWELADELRTKH